MGEGTSRELFPRPRPSLNRGPADQDTSGSARLVHARQLLRREHPTLQDILRQEMFCKLLIPSPKSISDHLLRMSPPPILQGRICLTIGIGNLCFGRAGRAYS
jgi:hypothetical protein